MSWNEYENFHFHPYFPVNLNIQEPSTSQNKYNEKPFRFVSFRSTFFHSSSLEISSIKKKSESRMQRKRSNWKKWKDVITFPPLIVDQDFHKARTKPQHRSGAITARWHNSVTNQTGRGEWRDCNWAVSVINWLCVDPCSRMI